MNHSLKPSRGLSWLLIAAPWVLFGRASMLSAAPATAVREPPVIATLEGHRDGVKRVAFSPDGGRLLTQGPDELLLWDLATKKSVKVVPRPPFLPARFSHDGKLIFMEHLGDNAEIFDVATGATRRVKSDPQVSGCFNSDGASQVRFRPDGASMHRRS